MRRYRKFKGVLVEDLRNDPEHAHAYLQVSLEKFEEDGDTEHLIGCLAERYRSAGWRADPRQESEHGKDQLIQSLV